MTIDTTSLTIITQEDGRRTVNARELHIYLDNTYKFTTWIRDRIEQYGFIEGEDYITLKDPSQHQGRLTEWHLSLDMAKEISMMEKTERGKSARKYFLNCEAQLKELRAAASIPNFDDPIAAALAWVEEKKKIVEMEQKLIEMQPKVDLIDKLTETGEHVLTVDEFTKILYSKNLIIGRNRLHKWLRDNDYIDRHNIPYQKHIAAGRFKLNVDINNSTKERMCVKFFITSKGQLHIIKKMQYSSIVSNKSLNKIMPIGEAPLKNWQKMKLEQNEMSRIKNTIL